MTVWLIWLCHVDLIYKFHKWFLLISTQQIFFLSLDFQIISLGVDLNCYEIYLRFVCVADGVHWIIVWVCVHERKGIVQDSFISSVDGWPTKSWLDVSIRTVSCSRFQPISKLRETLSKFLLCLTYSLQELPYRLSIGLIEIENSRLWG